MASEKTNIKAKEIVYFLPNCLTSAGLFAAYYSIISALKGDFETSAIAIFIAMILDTFDGRVARMTKTESAFGAQYDSLADMVSFGIAPALVLYSWSLHNLGKFGWLASFTFAACAALRLARFNTNIDTTDKKHFQGLPSPAGAAIVASIVWVGSQNGIMGHKISILIMFICVITAILMVSNIRYYSFKNLDFKGKMPFVVGVVNVLIFIAVALDPPIVLLLVFSSYALSGPVTLVIKSFFMKKRAKALK